MKIVVLGLSLSSAWGNGHAVTYRALLRAMAERGHDILFLERDTPWYAAHRDLPSPGFCRLELYDSLDELDRWKTEVAAADAVIVGSFAPDGVEVGRWVKAAAKGIVGFYDIDTPVTLARLGEPDAYLTAGQIADYDVYFSFTGGPTLRKLEQRYHSPMARALYCSADPAAYRPLLAAPRWDLSYLGTYSADRQPVLERLLLEPALRAPHLRFAVAGSSYPDDIVWPANVERVEHLPPEAHPAFYAASRFALNATRADMTAAGFSPSVRLFEAAACAAPVISDVWPGIETIFQPGAEILLATQADDVLEALATADGPAIGAAARRRFFAEHTPAHRAETMERSLMEAGGRGSKPGGRIRRAVKGNDGPRVLVAGGAGFLGSHLCDRLLAESAQVVCVDNLLTGQLANLEGAMRRPGFEMIRHDIIEPLPARLTEGPYDRIYNLACAASPPLYQADPEHTLLTSVIGMRNLLRLAERTGARVLQASTSEIYGDPHVHPQPESYWGNVNSTGPRACYDEGKRAAETLAFDFDRAGRAQVRLARIFNTYGPRLSAADGRVVSNLISQALCGEDITIYGDGRQTRSFCYVDDLVGGLIALMEHEGAQPGPVNLGNPTELTILELVERVLALTGSSSKVVHRPLPIDDPKRRRPDISKAAALLGWRPVTPVDLGLRATIRWFDEEQGARPAIGAAAAAAALTA